MTTQTLDHDGATAVIDGRTYRLVVTPDEGASINDYDCYGRFDYGIKSDGWSLRAPEDFDQERSELLSILNDVGFWEPPAGFEDWPEPAQRALRHQVRDLVSFGFHVVTVERIDGTDAYGRPIVVDFDSVCGVDTTEPGELAYTAADLVDNLQHRAVTA